MQVFIDIKDNSDILMNCDGAVLERKSLNRIFVQAFLSGSSDCSILLNDVEALLLQGKGELSVSMSRQVRLNNVVLHPCVKNAIYKSTREINFKPLDGYPFELLRASIDPYVSPPVTVNMLMEYSQQRNTVRITASFSVRKKHNLHLRPIKDLVIKFPIPSSWSSQFLADTTFGSKKSVRSTSVLRGSFRRKIKSSSCQIETQLGSARYEPAFGAVMWRIGHYVESLVPHTFRCDVELKPGRLSSICIVCSTCMLGYVDVRVECIDKVTVFPQNDSIKQNFIKLNDSLKQNDPLEQNDSINQQREPDILRLGGASFPRVITHDHFELQVRNNYEGKALEIL